MACQCQAGLRDEMKGLGRGMLGLVGKVRAEKWRHSRAWRRNYGFLDQLHLVL